MKQQFYPKQSWCNASIFQRSIMTIVILCSAFLIPKAKAQDLSFRNGYLQWGTAGQVNAVYRFPSVTGGVDALVTISGRSSSQVKLVSIDLTNTGFSKSFQPQVAYNNGTTPSGTTDWWMEFTITFINSNSSQPVSVNSVAITALDVDGNGDRINEWLSFYGHKTYVTEANSQLLPASIWEQINGVNTAVGTKIQGPTANYANIDTNATRVMVTANYENSSSIRIRTGGHSTGSNGAADRMYSFWFKSFSYLAPVEARLPVTLQSFTATLVNKKAQLNWVSAQEENLNVYVLERSTNGSDFTDAAYVFANGNTSTSTSYSYADAGIAGLKSGMVYYRLRMEDLDGKFKYSPTRMIRIAETAATLSIQAFPNPAINELRITVTASWQNQKLQYDLYTINGQQVKRFTRNAAGQTEVLDISNLAAGTYLVKVTAGNESAVQQFVKAK